MNPTPDARTIIEQLPAWPTHYNGVYPHKALGDCAPDTACKKGFLL